MSWTICAVTYPKAQKEYDCDACRVIQNFGLNDSELTFSEYRSYIKAKRNQFKIAIGQKYVRCHGFYDGEPHTFRAIPDLDEVCRRNGYYDD